MIIRCAHTDVLPIEELKKLFNPKNPNTHTDEQIERLAKVLEYQGARSPARISKRSNLLTAGHGRIMAAEKAGWDSYPVDYQDYESEEAEYADLVADNALSDWSQLDLVGINAALPDLGPDFDIDMLGIKDFVLEPTEKFEAQCDEDEVPEAADTRCKPGDIWKLGNHRLMCGDSTSVSNIESLMGADRADVVFTSPPYNVGIDYNSHDDKMSADDYEQFMRSVMVSTFAFLKEGRIVAWNVGVSPKSAPHRHVVWLEESGFQLYRNIVWKKTGCAIPLWQNTKKNPLARYYLPNYNHEMIYLVSKGDIEKGAPTEMPEELCMDVWDVSQFAAGGNNHPAAFPVHLAEMAIKVLSAPGEIAFEPFGGSGTSIIACEKSARRCFAMEIDPHYCDVILARWEKYTGKKAELINA